MAKTVTKNLLFKINGLGDFSRPFVDSMPALRNFRKDVGQAKMGVKGLKEETKGLGNPSAFRGLNGGLKRTLEVFKDIKRQTSEEGLGEVIKDTRKEMFQLDRLLKRMKGFEKLSEDIEENKNKLKLASDETARYSSELADAKRNEQSSRQSLEDVTLAIKNKNRALKRAFDQFGANSAQAEKLKIDISELSAEQKKARIEVKNHERATKQSSNALIKNRNEVLRLGDSLQSNEVRLESITDELKKNGVSTDRIAEKTTEFRKRIDRLNKSLDKNRQKQDKLISQRKKIQNLNQIGISGLGAAFAGRQALGFLNAPLATGQNLEAQLSAVSAKALSDLSLDERARQLARFRQQALELGSTTVFTATQVAEAQEILALGGLSPNEILAAVPNLLKVAKAGKISLEDAADISLGVLRGFALEVNQLGRVGDVLAATSVRTSTDILELGGAFKFVSTVSKDLDVSLEKTAGLLGVLANQNIRGGEAGRHLKNILARLAAQTPQAAEKIDGLGIKVRDSENNMRNLLDIIEDFSVAMSSLGNAEKIDIVKDVVGIEAMTSFLAIMNKSSSAEGVNELKGIAKEMENVGGIAERIGNIMSNNTAGAVKGLGSAVEGLQIAFSNLFLSDFRSIVEGLTGFTRGLTDFVTKHPRFTKAIGFVALGIAGLAIAGGTLTFAIASLAGMFTTLSIATPIALAGLSAIGAFLVSPLGLGILALAGLAGTLAFAFSGDDEEDKPLQVSTDEAFRKEVVANQSTFNSANNIVEKPEINISIVDNTGDDPEAKAEANALAVTRALDDRRRARSARNFD